MLERWRGSRWVFKRKNLRNESVLAVSEIKEGTKCDFIVPETRMLSCQILETT